MYTLMLDVVCVCVIYVLEKCRNGQCLDSFYKANQKKIQQNSISSIFNSLHSIAFLSALMIQLSR